MREVPGPERLGEQVLGGQDFGLGVHWFNGRRSCLVLGAA